MLNILSDKLMRAVQELPRIIAWVDNFSISGDGVNVQKNRNSIAVTITQEGSRLTAEKSIKNIRYNGDTHNLQVAYVPEPADDSGWEDKVQFTVCSGVTPGEFFSY